MNKTQLDKALGTIKNYIDKTSMNHFELTAATDFNTLKTTGIYSIKASGNVNTHHVPTANHGTLIVDFSVGTPFQLWLPDQTNTVYKRSYTTSSSTWGAWTNTYTGNVTGSSSSCTGNAASATKLQTARNIALTGNVTGNANFDGSGNISITTAVGDDTHEHNHLKSRGRVTAESGTTYPAQKGLSMSEGYNNGYSVPYGNVLTMYGSGVSQLYIGWSGTSGAHEKAYIRSKRDTNDANYSGWAQIYTSAHPQGSVTGSSGSCTGNAATATKLATARTINGTSFDGSANITTANWGTSRKLNRTAVNGSADVSIPLDYITCAVSDNNTNNYHLILESGKCTSDYTDKSIVIMVCNHYNNNSFGIAKATLRTNNASGGDKASGELIWIVRCGFAANVLCYNIRNTAKDTYMDVFYKSSGNYNSATIYILGEGARGNQSSQWTKNNTNATGTKAYTETAMKALRSYTSTLVSAVDAGVINKANQDSAGQQINKTYIKGLSVSGKTITYTKGDGTTGTITTQDTNTTYNTGNASTAGLTKLYTGTGTATDGTMTQAAIKSALDGKAASSHGTHVSYGGNGSASTVSRSDHSHSYLPLAGGTMSGKITTPNNAPGITFGDDATICDRNIANHIVIEGATATAGGITFGSGKDTNIYRGGANLLKTDDTFNAVGGFQWNGTSLDNRYAPKSHTHDYITTKGTNTINGTANDTTANWGAQGHSVHWYTAAGLLKDQPSQWGYILNIGSGTEVHQLWMTQASGNLAHRGGNADGWSGTWRTILDNSNFSSYALPLSGGTMTGALNCSKGLYIPTSRPSSPSNGMIWIE